MVNDNATLSFSDDSSNKSPPTPIMLKDELYQELDELLTAFRSDAQQQFCLDQDIIEKGDLERLQQTIQQLQYSLKINRHPHQHQQLLPSLTRIIQNILQHYGYACQQRNMRLLDEYLTNQYITDWHRLKQQWDLKAKENQYLHLIIEDIILLAQSWHQHYYNNNGSSNGSNNNSSGPIVMMASLSTLPKRLSSATKRSSLVNKRKSTPTLPPPTSSSTLPSSSSFSSLPNSTTSEDILTSILTTFDYPPGAYMVTIDKHNYKQLGLQHSKIGTRQIIFDGHQLSTNNIISIMHHLSDAFASLFAATAQTHLATIDTQIKKAQPFHTANAMKQLLAQITEGESPITPHLAHGSTTEHLNDICCDSQYHLHHHQQQQPVTVMTPQHRTSSSPSLAVLSPFRLSAPVPSNQPWHHPLPIPSFAPAPWQLPDLLKPRYPYNPFLFGMLRRKTTSTATQQQAPTSSSSSSSSFLKHALHSNQNRMAKASTPPPSSAPVPSRTENDQPMNRKKPVNTNAPNKSAPHHYHASSSATINGGSDNNIHHSTPPSRIRPPPRASSLTASTSLLLPQRRQDNGTGRRSKRYLHPMAMQEKVNATDDDDETDDADNGWRDNDKKMTSAATFTSTAATTTTTTSPSAPFTSVSVDKFSFYLGKIAGQFYQDLLKHTKVRYQESKETLEVLECQMLELYRHLQLASSRAVMYRALMIAQELLDNQQQQQHQHHQQQRQANYYSQQQQQQQVQCNSDFGCPNNQPPYSDPPSSFSRFDTDTTDSDSYTHQQQQQSYRHDSQQATATTTTTTKPLVNRWTPICMDDYQSKPANSSGSGSEEEPTMTVALDEKEQINSPSLPLHFYNALPPNDTSITMSETTLQTEHTPSLPPKEIVSTKLDITPPLDSPTTTTPAAS